MVWFHPMTEYWLLILLNWLKIPRRPNSIWDMNLLNLCCVSYYIGPIKLCVGLYRLEMKWFLAYGYMFDGANFAFMVWSHPWVRITNGVTPLTVMANAIISLRLVAQSFTVAGSGTEGPLTPDGRKDSHTSQAVDFCPVVSVAESRRVVRLNERPLLRYISGP